MRDNKGRFLVGNNTAKKVGKICFNFPFCRNRISDRPNKSYCSPYCKKKAQIYKKHHNLAEKRGKNG